MPDLSNNVEQTHFQPLPGEVVLKKNLAAYMKSAINVDSGTLRLTNKRLLFCGEIGTFVKLAALGSLALLSRKGPKIHFQAQLPEIDFIVIKKHGFGKKMVLKTTSGKEYAFAPSKFDSWKEALTDSGIKFQ